jgi:molecular chaperone GrpE
MSKISKNEQQEPDQPPAPPAPEQAAPQEGGEEAKDQVRILEAVAAEAQKRAEALQAENSELKDQYLRKLADYENFRKRMFREKSDAVQFANTALLQDILGILDDFDRAIQSSEVSKDFQILHDGITMVRNRFFTTLEGKYGLAQFDSADKPFDPNIHEAVAMEQGAVKEPVVVEEFLKGYTLNGRILRAAKVRVRMPGGEEKTAPAESAQENAAGAETPSTEAN